VPSVVRFPHVEAEVTARLPISSYQFSHTMGQNTFLMRQKSFTIR
jgi:hypothetical protein